MNIVLAAALITEFTVRLVLTPGDFARLPDGRLAMAWAWMDKDRVCYIHMPRNKYPRCLQHEVRHCIEGNWHKGRVSTEDCE